jgi:hypothetical protein
VLRPDGVGRVVEIDEVAGRHVDGADAEADVARVDAVEVHQAFERCLERSGVIVAGCFGAAGRLQPGRRHAWFEKSVGAMGDGQPGARLVDQRAGQVALRGEQAAVERPERACGHRRGAPMRRRRDQLPEGAKLLQACLRRIAHDEGRIDRADRDSRDPVGQDGGLGQSLIDSRLVGAERAASLQQQGDALESGPAARPMRLPMRFRRLSNPRSGHSQDSVPSALT